VCRACLADPEPLPAGYRCARCGADFDSPHPLDSSGVCLACRTNLRPFDAVHAFTAYDGRVRELVHLHKYGRILPLHAALARWLLAGLPSDAQADVVVPVPIDLWKRYQRGFNQAQWLARAAAARLGAPLVQALRRKFDWNRAAQASRSARERRRAVRGLFRVARPAAVAGRRVLLVDDVFTTGSTAAACAAALKRAGAVRVEVAVVARVPRRIWESQYRPAPVAQGESAG
jgi:ComF family protein